MTKLISDVAHLTRQLDLIPLEVLTTPINIIGAGAIGSFTALSLAKMGFENITVFDDDHIDVENMNCQFYRFKDIGSSKVDALKNLIQDFTNVEINTINGLWEGQLLEGILIVAVDNMKTRQMVFDSHFKKAYKTKLILDPRMGAEVASLFCYNPLSPSEGESYSNSLYSDEDAVPERCTSKSTIFSSMGISSQICANVKTFLVDGKYTKSTTIDMVNNEMY